MRPGRCLALWALLMIASGSLACASAAASPHTIFGVATPATIDSGDTHSVELGVKFSSEVAGNVTGVRFYKAPANKGAHTGSLWSAAGTLLASAEFTGESASGWQQVNFSEPVAIAADTTYVAAYLAPKGHYSDTASGFAAAGVSNPPLSALANPISANGVYAYSTTSTFPSSTFEATNYWVDVDFQPAVLNTAPGQVTKVTATPGPASASLTWSAPSSGGVATSYTITPYIGSSAQPATTISGSPPATNATVTGLTDGASYTFTVQASNAFGSGPASEHSGALTPTGVVAYPDLQVLMPTGEISIHHSGGTRKLEFTHITEDAGAGPLEIRPTYDALTGISQGYQALYTMLSPGVWKFAYTVPISGAMLWNPPSDYDFPLAKFWLYNAASGGGVGALAATSPKVDFCMTSDTHVGGVPNTPSRTEYPSYECSFPEGRLGLSVGWGDQYDATDGGEGIDISSLPSGTYWLRGEVDPHHYLAESSTANDITDTKLQIEDNTVKVLEQVHPSSTPPTVALTSPAAGARLSGTVALTASASSSGSIASVRFLLDGQPIGAPVASPPYTLNWRTGSVSAGAHFLSAQASDSNGLVGTAPDVPVDIEEGPVEEGPDTEPPGVSIVNPIAGQTVSNTVQVSADAEDNLAVKSVQFHLDGKALGAAIAKPPYALSWDTTTASEGSHTLTADATDISGNVGLSAPVTVTVENPAGGETCFVMDVNSSANGRGIVKTPTFTTAEGGEHLFAFVSADGPPGAGRQSTKISGAGVKWTLIRRASSQSGDAEIWTATARKQLKNASVKSRLKAKGYDQSLTVTSMQGSSGAGASVAAGGATGEPSTTLSTTANSSLVYAVGSDWSSATSRTLGSNQVILRQVLDAAAGKTFWSQYTDQFIGASGTVVQLNDPAPANDQWNMAAVEILADED